MSDQKYLDSLLTRNTTRNKIEEKQTEAETTQKDIRKRCYLCDKEMQRLSMKVTQDDMKLAKIVIPEGMRNDERICDSCFAILQKLQEDENIKRNISENVVHPKQKIQTNSSAITIFFIIVNILVFAAGYLSNSQDQIILNYGFVPDYLFKDSMYQLENSIARLFSSMFVHENEFHIAMNLLTLIYLGKYAESSVGSSRYFFIYIVSGIAGALFYGVIASYILGNGNFILIGASGAISGVLGIGAAVGNLKAYYWLIIQIVFAIIGSFTGILSIAFTAHIGGFMVGYLLTKLLIAIERKRKT